MPYNGSKFDLEGKYKDVFTHLIVNEEEDKAESHKFFKIKYTLNLLPACTYGEDGESMGVSDLLEEFGDTLELSIFET